MSIRDHKITDAQFNEKGVIAAPDTLTGTAAENKGVFDRFAREIIKPQFNALVEDFAQMEEATDNWSAEEAQRVQNENARQSAEQGRAGAENTRVQNEAARLSAESQRVENENARAAAESSRASAESMRDTAEKSRLSAESTRANAENVRLTAEEQRVNAESSRTENEAARAAAEGVRRNEEASRASAETERRENETARQTAETGRISAETARADAEQERQTAEAARAGAEAARAEAETARQTAEKSRASAEDSRHAKDLARSVWEAYDASKTYIPGNKVSFNGSSYLCIQTTTGHAPTDTAYWLLIAMKGVDGTGAGDMLASVYDPQGKAQDVFKYVTDQDRALANSVADYFLPLRGAQMTGTIIAPESVELIKGYGSTDTQYAKYTIGPCSHLLRAYGVNGSIYDSVLHLEPGRVVMATSRGNTHCNIAVTPDGAELVCNSTVTTNNQLITKKYVDDTVKAAQPVAHLVTLTASGWNSSAKTQTVSCADVVADESAQQILPMPAAASVSAYNDAGILCTGQGAGTLTFTAATVPTADIPVYVTITPVQFS